jgi:phage host-nuclease inhibitor protein Gam
MTKTTFLNSWDEVGEHIGLLGQFQAEHKKVTGEIDEQIALVKTEKEKFLNELKKNIDQTLLRIVEFAEEHMKELRTDEKKQMTFATGVIKTRVAKDYDYPSDKVLVAKLKKLNLEHLINTKLSPDKKGIKDESEENPELDIFKKLGITVEENIAIDVEPHF